MIFRLPNLLDLINKEADMNVEIEPNQIVYRENGRTLAWIHWTVVDALAAHTGCAGVEEKQQKRHVRTI